MDVVWTAAVHLLVHRAGHTFCVYKVLTEALWRTLVAKHSAAVRCNPQWKLTSTLSAQSCAEEHPPWNVPQVLTLSWGLRVYLCDKQLLISLRRSSEQSAAAEQADTLPGGTRFLHPLRHTHRFLSYYIYNCAVTQTLMKRK